MDQPRSLTPDARAAERAVIGAVRTFAAAHLDAERVCVALSGGADSLALTAGAVRAGLSVHAVVVDHGLQTGSAQVAARSADLACRLGATAEVRAVCVDGPGGPEAAARDARYRALDEARTGRPVLFGHTLDDQAETILLGFGRGSGSRSVAGMRAWSQPWGRPLLGIRRTHTRAACDSWGLPVWDDPHNVDPAFTRVRLRREVLPLMEDVLAGGVATSLARTATQLTEDADALDTMAADLLAASRSGDGLDVGTLAAAPIALRTRALRAWLIEIGVPAPVFRVVRAVDALISDWHGQGAIAVGGSKEIRQTVLRKAGRIEVRSHPR